MSGCFCSIEKGLAKIFQISLTPLINGGYMMNKDGSSFHVKEISSTNVQKAIGKLKTKKVLAMTKSLAFSFNLRYHTFAILLRRFLCLNYEKKVSRSMERRPGTSHFQRWRTTEGSNDRPISALPILSKRLEKVAFDWLYQYLSYNNIFITNLIQIQDPPFNRQLVFNTR